MAKIVSEENKKTYRVEFRVDQKTKDYLDSLAKIRKCKPNKVAHDLINENKFHTPFDEKLRNLEKYINDLELKIDKLLTKEHIHTITQEYAKDVAAYLNEKKKEAEKN